MMLQLAFQKLDCNGDGFISLDEIIMQLPVEGSTDSGGWCDCWAKHGVEQVLS